jgi:hypothetical protein
LTTSTAAAAAAAAAAAVCHVCGHGLLLLVQIWRISDLLYLPEEQVVAELEAHR